MFLISHPGNPRRSTGNRAAGTVVVLRCQRRCVLALYPARLGVTCDWVRQVQHIPVSQHFYTVRERQTLTSIMPPVTS